MSATTHAAKETMTVTEDDITFTVGRFDDGRSKPYVINFDNDGDSSKYTFNTDGFVTNIKVGTERYRVVYRTNGDLRRVRRTDSGARLLETEGIEEVDEDGMFERRRLYACNDCEDAWDAVCDEGVPSVCSIVGYGSPLTDAATASMETLCESFGNACSQSGGAEACVDQCECERSLAISLEWYSAGDLDLHVYEPSGVEVYYNNRNGVSSSAVAVGDLRVPHCHKDVAILALSFADGVFLTARPTVTARYCIHVAALSKQLYPGIRTRWSPHIPTILSWDQPATPRF